MTGDPRQEVTLRLGHADQLLRMTAVAGLWPRCCVWLIRIALERAVDALCLDRYGVLVSTRAQLLTLPKFVDADIAHDTAQLWYALSRVAHHHDYELAPTADELRSWHCQAVRVTDVLLAAVTPKT
jgi:hypothetical protein